MIGGREGGNDEGGKEGDKVKECSETTGPLFLLKELPRHCLDGGEVVGGGATRRGLRGLGLPTVTELDSLDLSSTGY